MGTLTLLFSSLIWAVLHSLTASHTCKGFIRRLMGESLYGRIYRFVYNAFAGLSILPILYLLVTLPDQPLYEITAQPWLFLVNFGQGFAALLLVVSVLQTGPLPFMGISQLLGQPEKSQLVTDGLYAHVRHPIYSASLLFLWLTPSMTVNRLIIWIIFTIYFIIGAWFEERKLRKDFGQAYMDYQKRTPMLIPNFWKKNS